MSTRIVPDPRPAFNPADPWLNLADYTDLVCPHGDGCTLRYSRYTRELWCINRRCKFVHRLTEGQYGDLVDLIMTGGPVAAYLVLLARGGDDPPPPAPAAWLTVLRERRALIAMAEVA